MSKANGNNLVTHNSPLKILILSAYDAESHKAWRLSLAAVLPHVEFTHLVLPARFFAWRIRGNPLSWFNAPELQRTDFDACIATSMVDIASLRGMRFPALNVPVVAYFHENQFAYPKSEKQKFSDDPKVVQLYSALAADFLCFNSQYNFQSFIGGARAWMGKMPDHVDPVPVCSSIETKARVLPVPIMCEKREKECEITPLQNDKYQIVWNHRWEYDKGPHRLLAMLRRLPTQLPVVFHIVGQSFRSIPEEMMEIKALLIERRWLGVWGYQENTEDYRALLRASNFVLSTSEHDFQGLAIQEAVTLNCEPILPNRLVYPELFEHRYLYEVSDNIEDEAVALATYIRERLAFPPRPAPDAWPFGREALVPAYEQLLSDVLGS